ncbi:MAG: PA14 domain-containing protein [Acidimicrobiia bacterium]
MTRDLLVAACILIGATGFAAGRRALPQTGLRGNYFTNVIRSGEPAATAVDATASTDTLANGIAKAWSSYSVEWTGAIVITQPGTYTFATVSDDGSELDVGDVTVVRNGGQHGPQEATGRIELDAGVHPLRLRYEQLGGGLYLELKYAAEGQPLVTIPAAVLLPEVTSLAAHRARSVVPYTTALIAVLLFLGLRRWLPAVDGRLPRVLQPLGRPAVAIGLLLLVAVVMRVVMMLGSDGILWADSDVFIKTFGSIRNGRWFEHDPYRTLTYPYFLTAFLVWSTEKPMDQVLIGAQHLLGIVTVVALFYALRAAFTVRIALVAALLVAVHTTQLFYEKSILTEALFNCLLAQSLLAVVHFWRSPTFGRAVAVAAACLILTLTRPVAQGFIVVPVVLALCTAATWRQRVLYAGAMTAIYVVALQPWMAVNQRTYGFHGVALGQGLGLFIRTSQVERYEPAMYHGYPEVEELLTFARTTQSATGHVVDGLRRRGLSSAKIDDLLYRASISAIAQRPFEFAGHSLLQWWRQLGPLDDEDICTVPEGRYICSDRTIGYAREPFLNRPRRANEPVRPWVVWYFEHLRIPMRAVTVLAAFGVIASLRGSRQAVPLRLALVMTAVYYTMLPAITQSLQDRFRLPVDGLLFAFAAFGLAALARIVLRRSSLE